MSRPKRTSAVAGMALALALAVTPAAQAAGPVFPFSTSWLEIGLDRLASWWGEVTAPRRVPSAGHFDAKISTASDPNSAPAQNPPPTDAIRDNTGTIDPNG